MTSLVDENGEPTAAQKAYADNMAAACGVSVEGLEHLMKQDMKRKIAAMRMYGEQESPPTGGWQSCCKGVQTWAMGKESVFVENLERLAGLHNLNMQTVAALCGVSESAISKWRSGDRSPGFASALKIADVFQVDAGRLARADFSDLLAHELASPERYEEAEKTIARLKREWSGEEKKVVPIEKNRKRGRKSR